MNGKVSHSPWLPGVDTFGLPATSWASSSHLLLCPISECPFRPRPSSFLSLSLCILSLGNGIHCLHLKYRPSVWKTPPVACPTHISPMNLRLKCSLACYFHLGVYTLLEINMSKREFMILIPKSVPPPTCLRKRYNPPASAKTLLLPSPSSLMSKLPAKSYQVCLQSTGINRLLSTSSATFSA